MLMDQFHSWKLFVLMRPHHVSLLKIRRWSFHGAKLLFEFLSKPANTFTRQDKRCCYQGDFDYSAFLAFSFPSSLPEALGCGKAGRRAIRMPDKDHIEAFAV
jgi:hypothetical protein